MRHSTELLAAVAASIWATCAAVETVPIIQPSDPETFTLGQGNALTQTYSYIADPSTRFVMVSAHSTTGLIELTVTSQGWQPNVTVGKVPGLSIEFGYDGSAISNPQFNGSCNPRVVGWTPPKQPTHISITVSMFTLYSASSNYSTAVVLTVTPYGEYTPIPGACCATCLQSNAVSSLVVRDKGEFDATIVLSQAAPASVGWPWSTCACDGVANQDGAPVLEYNLYFYFVGSCGSAFRRTVSPDAVTTAVERMTSVENILKYGTKLNGLPLLPIHLEEFFHVDATAGQGVVYAVVVTDLRAKARYTHESAMTFMSAYASFSTFRCRVEGPAAINCSNVPSRTDCDLFPECVWEFEGPQGHCVPDLQVLPCSQLFSMRDLVFTMVVGVGGAFIALFGHRYFVTQLGMDALLFFGAVTYLVLANYEAAMPHSSRLYLSCGGGVVGSLMMLYWWFWSRGIAISLVVMGGVCGIVVTLFVFSTSVGEYRVWENPFNFGMAAICGLLIPPIFMMLWDRSCTIVAAAVTGSYFFLMSINFFVASNFDDILLNTIRRLTDSNFGKDYSGNYFSNEFNGCSNVDYNVGMLAAWAGLSCLTAWFQFKVSARLRPGSRYGAGSPPVSDRFDKQCCPIELTTCCQAVWKGPSSYRRVDEGWASTEEDEAHPLVEVSGSNGFRQGSVSSWGSWTWMRNAARGSQSRRSSRDSMASPVRGGAGAGAGGARPPHEARPLLEEGSESDVSDVHDDVFAGRDSGGSGLFVRSGRGSSRAVVYEDEMLDADLANAINS
eukprot:m.51590 g.51590  ORF g.51590 m.51590 type:complete len:781 (+) comp7320_c0_seq1:224-2566(+)